VNVYFFIKIDLRPIFFAIIGRVRLGDITKGLPARGGALARP